MTRVLLVRHAMPVVDPTRPPAEWDLSADGRERAERLRGRIPGDAVPLSSPETKARSTLALALGRAVETIDTDHRLAEVHRPGEPVDGDFRDRRRAWVEGRPDHRHTGWETPDAAAARVDAALAEFAARTGAECLVVGTHGLVSTAWLVSIGQVRPGPPAGRFWRGLTLPDLIEVFLP